MSHKIRRRQTPKGANHAQRAVDDVFYNDRNAICSTERVVELKAEAEVGKCEAREEEVKVFSYIFHLH